MSRQSYWLPFLPLFVLVLPLIILSGAHPFLAGVAAEDDPNGQYLGIVSGVLDGHGREITLPVEPGVARLELVLTGGGDGRIVPLGLRGEVAPLDEPNIVISVDKGRRSILVLDPRPGTWRVRLEGTGAFSFFALVQGDVYACCGQIFTRNQIYTLDRIHPLRGSRHQVQIFASGYAIETIDIVMIDEQGKVIAPVRFRQNDPSNISSYLLLLETPDRPFRIQVQGIDLNGRQYRRVLFPLLTPEREEVGGKVVTAPEAPSTSLDELAQTARSGERKVLRAHVVHWSDEPLLTEKRNTIGVRIRYTINFPETAIYSPYPSLYPDRPDRVSTGYTGALNPRLYKASMRPLSPGSPPWQSWTPGSRATYIAGLDYEFEVDFVPNYAIFQEGELCRMSRPYSQDSMRDRFEMEIRSSQRMRFRFTVSGSDLEGRGATLTERSYVPALWLAGIKSEAGGQLAECR